MAFEEGWLAHVLAAVAERHGPEIEATFETKLAVPTVPFPRVTLERAKEMLREAGHDAPAPVTTSIPPASVPCRP